jgi:hypothetical protein
VDIIVTSVHQTTAGKMIFGRYDDRELSRNHVPQPVEAAPRTVEAPPAVPERLPRAVIPDTSQS